MIGPPLPPPLQKQKTKTKTKQKNKKQTNKKKKIQNTLKPKLAKTKFNHAHYNDLFFLL